MFKENVMSGLSWLPLQIPCVIAPLTPADFTKNKELGVVLLKLHSPKKTAEVVH